MSKQFNPGEINALAHLRHAARTGSGMDVAAQAAINVLDNAGVFAALDEQTDYACTCTRASTVGHPDKACPKYSGN